MNTRQWNLYNYLKHQTDFVKREDIARDLGLWDSDAPFQLSSVRREMTDDIKTINESDTIQKIIISTGQGIKIASPDEFYRYRKSEYGQIFRKLARLRKLERKAGLHNQKRVVFNSEREFIEAFM